MTKIPSQPASSRDDDDESSSSDGAGSNPNGAPAHPANHHPRSASTSIPDIRRPSAQPKNVVNNTVKARVHSRAPSITHNTNTLAPGPGQSAALNAASANGAKESFLNYFFGGPGGPPNGNGSQPTSTSAAPQSTENRNHRNALHMQTQPATRDLLPDLGSGRRNASRSGFDGGTTAFDMKSLGKHLEPVCPTSPLHRDSCTDRWIQSSGDQPLHLTPREEMETNLIRSLIASYFGITRQTIEDLVPKAVMHLLVSRLQSDFDETVLIEPGQLFSRRDSTTPSDFLIQTRPVRRPTVRRSSPCYRTDTSQGVIGCVQGSV